MAKIRKKNKSKATKCSSNKISVKKKKRTIKVPPKFLEYITDKKMRKEFIEFANNQNKMPSFKELTSYANNWLTNIDGTIPRPDGLSLATYKLMRKDAQIQMGLKVIKYPIKAMKWWVVCSDKNIQAFTTYALKRVWKSMISIILNALDFGYSISEKVWEVQDVNVTRKEKGKSVTAYKGSAVLLKQLKDPDPVTLTIVVDEKGDFNGFKQQTSSKGDIDVPPEKSFVFTNEKEFGNLYGKSLLMYAYDFWYWAILMYQFLNRYYERRGTPPTIARAPVGRTTLSSGGEKDNLELAQTAGESLTESSVVALPSNTDEKGNYKWDLAYMNEDQRADMFLRYIEHLNAMKLRALFVPERMVVQDGEMGARAVAKTHLSVFLMGLEGLIEDIVDHINKYIVPQLVKYNFGDDIPPVYIETSGLRIDSKNLLKQIIISIIKRGDTQIPVDMIKALEELDLPIREDEEVTPIIPKKEDENIVKKEDDEAEVEAINKEQKTQLGLIKELLEREKK